MEVEAGVVHCQVTPVAVRRVGIGFGTRGLEHGSDRDAVRATSVTILSPRAVSEDWLTAESRSTMRWAVLGSNQTDTCPTGLDRGRLCGRFAGQRWGVGGRR
jgi:hypothetical protein